MEIVRQLSHMVIKFLWTFKKVETDEIWMRKRLNRMSRFLRDFQTPLSQFLYEGIFFLVSDVTNSNPLSMTYFSNAALDS